MSGISGPGSGGGLGPTGTTHSISATYGDGSAGPIVALIIFGPEDLTPTTVVMVPERARVLLGSLTAAIEAAAR